MWTKALFRAKGSRSSSAHSTRRKDLLQLFCPIDDDAQLAAVHTAPNHDEPAVCGDVVVCDAGARTEIIVIGEERRGFAEPRLHACGVGRRGDDALAAAVEDLTVVAAPPRLAAASVRHLPLPIQAWIAPHVDLRPTRCI